MNTRDRLLKFLEYKGINKASFEKEAGFGNGFVDKMTDNTRMSSLEKVSKFFPELDINWLRTGIGNMLSTPSYSNSNIITGGTNTNVKMSVNTQSRADVEEAEVIEDFETAPIIPSTWVKRQDFDIVEAIEDYGDELEQSKVAIAGTPIDAWHIIPDNSMYPHYQKGDKVALKNNPYKKIVPGRVYGIDSLPHGLLVRILFNTEGGFLARSFDKENYPDFLIEKEDINNILSVVCVVRL